ncbi:MAG: methyltransferase domain-containing protein [Spirochaetales bacterium]|nr:methyltransferase domain-containing protein [Spirochaetales bacterium]
MRSIEPEMEINRVRRFYDEGVAYEWRRLDEHPVEFEITTRHLRDYVGNDSLRIADVGGGPGRYSFHFARKGHKVTLIDLSPNNIEFAKTKSKELGVRLDGYLELSATDLSVIESETFDAVLCFGPLYHLLSKADHTKVLEECSRILKGDGLIAVVFLTPWAHAFSAIQRDPDILSRRKSLFFDLVESQYNTSTQDIAFPNGWNPKPENVIGYMESHYFRTERVVAVEGPLGRHLERVRANLPEHVYRDWMDYIFLLSTEKSLVGSCEHLLYIGRK